MSDTDRLPKRPQSKAGGSVPVLFSLRNVQPSIVAGTSKPKAQSELGENGVASPSPQTATQPANATPPAVSVLNAKPGQAPKASRSYNIVVGLLVIAVCLLVIKNTQRNSSNQKSVASNIETPKLESTKPDLAKPDLAKPDLAKPDLAKPETAKPETAKTEPTISASKKVESNASSPTLGQVNSNPPFSLDVNPSDVSIPQLPALESKPTNPESLVEAGSSGTKSADSSQVSSSLLPTLLSSAKPEPPAFVSSSPATPAASPVVPSSPVPPLTLAQKSGSEQAGLSFPEARTAMKSDGLPGNTSANSFAKPNVPTSSLESNSSMSAPPRSPVSSYQPLGSNDPSMLPVATQPTFVPKASDSQIVDTREPTVSTREMMDVFMGARPGNPSNPNAFAGNGAGTPATPVSNVGPRADSARMPGPIPNPTAQNPNPALTSNALSSSNYASDNGMLSGAAYPPTPKEYQPINLRNYEQAAMSNVAMPVANQNSTAIRQPSSNPTSAINSSNRYMNTTQPPVGAIPYKPMSPSPSGMTGYPPGIGN